MNELLNLLRATTRWLLQPRFARAAMSVGLLVCCAGASGDQPEPLPVEDALSAKSFCGLSFGESFSFPVDISGDGQWVAFALEDPRRKQPSDRHQVNLTATGAPRTAIACDIWVARTDTGQATNLTGGKGNNWAAAWSPDGAQLAFYSDRDGYAALWVWERKTARLRRISRTVVRPFLGEVPRWAIDGKQIFTKILPEDLTLEQAMNMSSPAGTPAGERQEGASTAVVYRSPGVDQSKRADAPAGPLIHPWHNEFLADLALIDVRSGQVRRIVRKLRIRSFAVSPNGRYVAVAALQRYAPNSTNQYLYDVFMAPVEKGEARVAASGLRHGLVVALAWAPDGRAVAYTNSDGDCLLLSPDGGPTRPAVSGRHPAFRGTPIWSDSSDTLYFVHPDGIWRIKPADGSAGQVASLPGRVLLGAVPLSTGRFWFRQNGAALVVRTRNGETMEEGFYQVDLGSGAASKLREENAGIESPVVSADGRTLIYVDQSAQRSPDLWVTRDNTAAWRQLTHFNPALENYRMASSRLIEWKTSDGARLRGSLLLPAGYQPGRRYPLIVTVYGGATPSAGVNRFGLSTSGVENRQLLATRGYAVLAPDMPLRNEPGRLMEDHIRTVMPGVDQAIALGIADPERLGVMGHSHGGYGTMALIVQTPRFKAAIMRAGFGNLFRVYGDMTEDGEAWGTAWAEKGWGRLGGPPWQFPQRYIENSPVLYLDRVKTPLLIIHGNMDWGHVPAFTGEIFVLLKHLGREVTYARYEKEGHWEGHWGYINQVDYCKRMIAWFDDHLKN